MVPEGWREVRVDDVAAVVGGGTPSRSNPDFWSNEVHWATPSDITSLRGRYISRTGSQISAAGLAASAATVLPAGSVLMTSRATIGSWAINAVPMATNQGFQSLVPRPETDTRFLAYAISNLKPEFVRLAAGSTFLEISRRSVGGVRFICPPLPEQRKIAEILSSVDDAIEATQAVIDQLQVVKKALMAELLTRGIPGRHSRFRRTEIGEVPAGWEVMRIGDAGAVDAGKAKNPNETGHRRPYLRAANVFDGELRLDDVAEMVFSDGEFRRFELASGDLLLNEGQSLELVGRCAQYRGECGRPVAMQNALLRFRAGAPVNTDFAEQYFRYCQQSGRFAAVATKTTSIAHLGLKRFADMSMPIPPLGEQAQIARVLRDFDTRLAAERAAMAATMGLKSSLLAALLSGDIRVAPTSSEG